MNHTPDRVAAVFNGAVDHPPGKDREAFLREHCAEDEALLARLNELLLAYDSADGFLEKLPLIEQSADDQSAEVTAHFALMRPEKTGDRIGHYKLLQQIGEGGFGVVWMAEQEQPVRRRVALKIIKVGMDTREVVARFEQERQALAMMDHPNIAKVFDAGATQYGRPFFVMELVRGVRITDYCDQANLPTAERLKLFITVCHAVQHAHQKGIIHRDLKPSNILVTLHDGVPVPKVIDFGVAKATQQQRLTDLTLFTQFEQMIGTPLYMSPEQAEMSGLDIDTRSDIYSLGVLLYELLAGRTPFDPQDLMRAGYDEVRRVIREQEPQKPSTFLSTMAAEVRTNVAQHRQADGAKLISSIRGDLDWIVMKALEKDRTRRYETANGLASDIQRHLTDEPVLARPASQLYRFRRLVRRNKGAFAAGAAVAAALVAGFAASVWQAVRAEREATRAVAAEKRTSNVLLDLQATAPAFAEQARTLAAKEQFDEAIDKLNYALKLRPDSVEYLSAKADLLQCQLRLAEAATAYRAVLALAPKDIHATMNAALCDKLLAANADPQKLTRESLSELFAAMHAEHRSAAELMRVGKLLNEEKKVLLAYWLERLKGLPIPPQSPLVERLTMRDDGLLALDLSATNITDLRPLEGMPLGNLKCDDCEGIEDLGPLRGMPLKELYVRRTHVADLSPLKSLPRLERLYLGATKISDVAALRGLPLKELAIGGTAVTELSPLQGMPLVLLGIEFLKVNDLTPLVGMKLKTLVANGVPAKDFTPLSGMPLEKLSLQETGVGDLGVLLGMPLRELVLYGCAQASNYSVLSRIPSLEILVLPQEAYSLPDAERAAVAALKAHPKLEQLDAERPAGSLLTKPVRPKQSFWEDWDRQAHFFAPLRKAGGTVIFNGTSPDGTWNVTIQDQAVSDIACLKGAPISALTLFITKVTDLSPLEGMPLKALILQQNSKVTNLRPLKSLPLFSLLMIGAASGMDVGVLAEVPSLERILLPPDPLHLEALRSLPKLKYISFAYDYTAYRPTLTSEQFWKDRDQQATFLDPLRKQGFKVTMTTFPDTTWNVSLNDQSVSDISCLKGAPISQLHLMNTKVADLSPLAGMPLKALFVYNTKVTDLRPLHGLPLTDFYFDGCASGIDVSVLAAIPTLDTVLLSPDPKNLEAIRHLPNLKYISYELDATTRRPSLTAEQFWKQPLPVEKLIEQGKLAEAEQSLRERISAGRPRDERLAWLKLALVEIMRGDHQSYRTTCAEMVKHFKDSTTPNEVEVTAKVCLLIPDSGIAATDIAALIERGRAMDGDSEERQWFRQTCGLFEYRSGHWAAAAEQLDTSYPKRSVVHATNSILRAMIYHQQKDRAAALTELKGARERMSAPRTPTNPQDWLVASLLLREAEQLIGDPAPETARK